MNKKIVKKMASILMLLAIMSTTLSNPIMNIGHVFATSMNESSEAVAEVAPVDDTATNTSSDAIDSNKSSDAVDSNTSSDKTVAEVNNDVVSEVSNVTPVDNSSTVVEQPIDVVEPIADAVNSSSDTTNVVNDIEANSSTQASSTSSKSSTPAVITPLVQPEEGICNDSNSNPPKFTSFVQEEGTNNFIVGYSGGTPEGYTATSITFNLNFGDKDFIATNAVEGGNFIFDDTDREGILVLTPDEAINLANNIKKGNGNNPSKYTVTFTYITDSGISCTRTVDAEGFKDYVPVFPTPVLLAARTCIADEISIGFNPDETKYPTGAEFKIFEDVNGTGVAVTDALPINTNYNDLLTGMDIASHSYYAVIDVDGFDDPTLDEFNVMSDIVASGAFVAPPTVGNFNVTRVGNTIVPDFTDVSFNEYPDATATIIVDGPEADDTQSFPVDISNPTPIVLSQSLAPGTYSVHLHIEYGQCAPIDSREITFTVYPAPSFNVTNICAENGEVALVEFTFGDIEDPSGAYPSDAQIILLDSEGMPIGDPYAIDTASITLTNPGDYSIGIDLDGDGMISGNEPVSDPITFALSPIPSIASFNAVSTSNTITPEYTINYTGEHALIGTLIVNNLDTNDTQTFTNIDLSAPANPIMLASGTYSIELLVDYGGCSPISGTVRAVIPPDDTPYPAPTFDVTYICDENGAAALVDFTFGNIEDPSGPYPSDAQIILLDEEGVVGDPYAIDTQSITLTNPGNYSIGIDIDGDGMLEEGDPISAVIPLEAEVVPTIDTFKLSVMDNSIAPEYSVSYDGENALTGMITIDSPVLDEPIIIDISSDTFGDNLDAIANLKPGVYSATLSVDYGGCTTIEATSADVTISTTVDEPPVNEPPVEEPPANKPPKLVYTGLEDSSFDSFVMNIKEILLNVF